MPLYFPRCTLLLAAALALVPAAQAAPKKAAKPAAAKLAEIELVHPFSGHQAEQFERIVAEYNATNPAVKVAVSGRNWEQGALPDLLVLAEADEQRFLAGKPRYRPLHQVMREAKVPMDTLRPPEMMAPHPLDARNRLNALPIALATPVMYVNKDAFRKAGLDAERLPRSWHALQEALGTLYDAGVACPYTSSLPVWVHVENTSAWHNEPVVQGGKREALAVNRMLQVKHLALMSSWYKSRYLHIFGRELEGDAKFASGECAVLTAPSSSYPALAAGGRFEVAVAPLPYHDDVPGAPQNTLADGPALWVAAGKRPEHYRAAAQFVRYLLLADTQLELERHLGSLPLNRAGMLASGSELLKSDLAHVRVGLDTLTRRPPTASSRATRYVQRLEVREAMDQELEALWANKKPAKAVLDAMVRRTGGECRAC